MLKEKSRRIIFAILLILVMFIPVTVNCGHPRATCTSAPDKDGRIYRIYEKEPLIIYLLEFFIPIDLMIRYSEGKVAEQLDGYTNPSNHQ
jgi:hypothetical protein